MAAKKRKFSEDYVKFGFTFIEKDELQLPQCVILMITVTLERHLKQQHPTLVLKTKEFFSSEAESLKRMRLDKSGKEILYFQSLTAGTTSEDIFNSISNFVEKNYLDWKKLIGLCTDGAPAMICVRSGLAKKSRIALASKTLPQKLRQTLDSAIKIVNCIKSSALNSRLFTLLCEDLDSDHFFCSIQKYAGCPKVTLWLAFMH
ncbi:unnamed protein product [Acanthoscelides obtectus]|uniref:Uncharacterized protein n=1 Tax=Acanthoscelides obtectus TaxID=200917 RepID=A0A9P0P2K8_ACAOB|nr:unnamed protein product [Acanthoscelides obtectus]CAK1631644.1 Zinc finger BED domain-containing protein 5 [Acanthoscelides obtectus]